MADYDKGDSIDFYGTTTEATNKPVVQGNGKPIPTGSTYYVYNDTSNLITEIWKWAGPKWVKLG